MEPKLKAAQLVARFANHSMGSTADNNKHSAINCAIIMIEEILDHFPPTLIPDSTTYWNEVKEELHRLW